MNLKLLASLFFVFTFSICYGQDSGCATPTPKNKNVYSAIASKSTSTAPYECLNVRFHIVRNTNGTNAFVVVDTDDVIDELNEDFNEHGIFFRNNGTNFINNTNFVDIDSEAQTLANQNNVSTP